jgi:hypothetical protein
MLLVRGDGLLAEDFGQGLKPVVPYPAFAARLKPSPDTVILEGVRRRSQVRESGPGAPGSLSGLAQPDLQRPRSAKILHGGAGKNYQWLENFTYHP